MTKDEFWELIEQIRLEYASSGEEFIFTAGELFTGFSEKQVAYFMVYLKTYMFVYESNWLHMAAKVINGTVSDDSSLYFTLWLISQGEELFLETLKNPDYLANLTDIPWREAEFELLSAVSYQYTITEELTKQIKQSKTIIELTNELELKNENTEKNYRNLKIVDIPTLYPNLIARGVAEGFPLNN